MSTYYTDPHQNPYWQNLNKDRGDSSGADRNQRTFENDANWHPEPELGRQLGRTAAVFGIVAIFSTLFLPVVLPLALGSIAIVLAILSKGKQTAFTKGAKRAITAGIVALVLNLSILAAAVYGIYLFHTDPSARKEINRMSEQIYGYSFDDMLQQIMNQYGIDLRDDTSPVPEQPDSGTTVYPSDSLALLDACPQGIGIDSAKNFC